MFIGFHLSWSQPAVNWSRISMPARGWGWAAAGKSAESKPLDHQGWWPGARCWPVSCVEINFHIETESSKTSVYWEEKKSTVSVDRHTGGFTESCTLLVVWITFMGHFFQVSSDGLSCFAWFWVHIWYISGSSRVCVYTSSSRWILSKRLMGSRITYY